MSQCAIPSEGSIWQDSCYNPTELPSGQLDASALALALQAHGHAKLVDNPTPTPVRVELLKDDPLPNLP
jgi:hypothetical protein